HKSLCDCSRYGTHGVYERIIRVLVKLVDDRIVRRGAISGFANNRLKARQIRWNPDPLGCNLDSERLAEVDRFLRHLLRGAKHLKRLLDRKSTRLKSSHV